MPTYSYRCLACSDAFDIHQAFSDDSLTICPACGGELRKVFSPIGVSFTGSGFYRNDSREKPRSGDSAATSGDKSSSSAGESTSEKATPAAKEKVSAKTNTAASGGDKGSSSGSNGSSSGKTAVKSSNK